MYKKELRELWFALNNFDKSFKELKIALHTIDKLGFNVDKLYKQIDCVGIEMYKNKTMTQEFINEKLKIGKEGI